MKKLALIIFCAIAVLLLGVLPAMAFPLFSPTVVTLDATNITFNSATLSGTVAVPQPISNQYHSHIITINNSSGYLSPLEVAPSKVYFSYGMSPGNFTFQTPQQDLASATLYSANITDLVPGTTYYAQIVVVFNPVIGQAFELQGAGIGINTIPVNGELVGPIVVKGNIITFTTLIPERVQPSQPSSTSGSSSQGASMSNIVIQTAAVTTPKVAPGEAVAVTTSLINKGSHEGSSKITVYVNGHEEASQGVSLGSGQSRTLSFSVSRSDPGTYDVTVNNMPAGSFTVDVFNNNDALIYVIIGIITLAIVAVLVFIARRPAHYR